ncbi:MAG TPA: dephospho-CoA kinase [Phycisphaerae bacterium]|nr:dephospho-CoA kinase [Phycisphaerae bacterium]
MSNPKSEIRNPKSPLPPVLGLVGGIASGKSFVASLFAQLGCAVVDADRLTGDLLRDPATRQALGKRFGEEIFTASGEVDRRRLADAAFADGEALEALNSIMHPELCERAGRALDAARRRDVPAVILDAPLIFEKGLDTLSDFVVYIEASEEVRRTRAQESRGWPSAEIARREAGQVSLKAKRERADYIVDNNTSPEHTLEQIRRILARVGNR